MTEMKWIPVTLRTPKEGVEVLGYCVFYNLYHLCEYRGKKDDFGRPTLIRTDKGSDDNLILFWMALPIPPNVEVDKEGKF